MIAALLAAWLVAPAAAAVCEGSYRADGQKQTRWFDLGPVSGAQMPKNCLARAKDDLPRRKPADLGVSKAACDAGPVAVVIFSRLESGPKAAVSEAAVKTNFGGACPPPRAKP